MSNQGPLESAYEDRSLEDEMRSSYIDYAMSVIVGRALPDARDGLKPVHRRVIFAMNELGLGPTRPYRKCATVVGEVMGNYHPHGDQSIYDTLARLAQDFAIRAPLVDGQGNFGSVDGDRPAAMRYTEARMARVASEMVRDIDEDTVDFMPNFDGSKIEPVVLPSRFPNLLVNGSTGIAVGMATNIPPHNLGEVIDATVALIDNPDIDLDGLMEHIEGPDFPTGAHILGRSGIREAFETGRGRVRMQAVCHIEPIQQGKEALIVTELPYMVRKGGEDGLITKIAALARDKKIPEISDLRDESDRNGMRLVIELKRDVIPDVVKNKLFKHTPMQQTFGVNTVALVDGVPQTLSLKAALTYYLSHQKEVITRRTKYRLRKAESRAHILAGLLIAVGNIDEVVALIRASSDPDAAREGLMTKFELSREQAQAILDLRLQRLTAMEADKIQAEFDDLTEQIKELRTLLGEETLIYKVIREELLEVREAHADERRTKILDQEGDIPLEDLIADRQMVISITNSGYIKSLPLDTYRSQKRGGVGIKGMDTKEDDYIEHLFVTSTHDFLLFFTNRGKVYRQKVYELPEMARTAKGRALVNLLPLREGERVQAVIATRDFKEAQYLAFATRKGQVKKTEFLEYNTPIKADGIIAINIKDDDELVAVRTTTGNDDILMISKSGQAVRFKEEEARPMGRSTGGVRGMNVSREISKGVPNEVIAMEVASDECDLLVVTQGGYGKRTAMTEYPIKGRGTMGVQTIKLTDKKGGLAAALIVREGDELLFMSQGGMVQRTSAGEISQYKRASQGVRVMNIKEDDEVSAVAPVMEGSSEDKVVEEAASAAADAPSASDQPQLAADVSAVEPEEDSE
ncbi:MAG: DNA gyrase subunit A [Solirubrobacterales bacterium]|nr:DNA gyrase subunit A [Solirubrobacterales bacterium]